jgi:hypothetical protein
MIFIWLVAGCALVVAAFFIPGVHGDIWQSVDTAGIAAAIYLFALIAFTTRRPFPVKSGIIIWVAFFVCLSAITSGWKSLEAHSRTERDQKREIVGDITRSSTYAEIQPELLRVLKLYHQQNGGHPKEPIGKFFRRLYPEVAPGSGFSRELITERPGRELLSAAGKIYEYVPVIDDSQIVIFAQHSQMIGRNEKFKNFNGLLTYGKIQAHWILTAKGVLYASDN